MEKNKKGTSTPWRRREGCKEKREGKVRKRTRDGEIRTVEAGGGKKSRK